MQGCKVAARCRRRELGGKSHKKPSLQEFATLGACFPWACAVRIQDHIPKGNALLRWQSLVTTASRASRPRTRGCGACRSCMPINRCQGQVGPSPWRSPSFARALTIERHFPRCAGAAMALRSMRMQAHSSAGGQPNRKTIRERPLPHERPCACATLPILVHDSMPDVFDFLCVDVMGCGSD